ncbi:glycosyltransferase family 2 protein [Microbacterium sp. NPDC055903]
MSAAPSVSIIVPVFNAGEALRTAFRHFDALTYRDFEVIVVDDGSTDSTTRAVIRERERADPRMTVIELDANVGPGVARNSGLAAARGQYVWFLDWDDEWRPEILSILVEAAERHGADIVMCRGRWRRDGTDHAVTDGSARRERVNNAEAFERVLTGELKGYLWTKLFRRSIVPPDVFPGIRTSEDLCGLVRILPHATSVVLLPDVLYFHVVREGSLTNSPNPPLENLAIARDVIRDASDRLTADDLAGRARLLEFYDGAYWYVAHATTAARHYPMRRAAAAAWWASRRIGFASIARACRISRPVAAKMLVLKTTGPLFPRARSLAMRTAQVMRSSG